jgi:16S rRNA (adenine1518-N6/adenine1519-N6)-dimethyltransferase|tara:strand:+ start:879 stop:1661 length:783 start_codon:yes stop_codon:yes gene_type:complete
MSGSRARKRFGQHFLIDNFIIEQIIALIDPVQGESLVEIGPGRGALTRPLIASGARITVIEIDRDLASSLTLEHAATANLNVVQGDALDFNFGDFFGRKPIRIVGNLPYNISTPLIMKLIQQDALIKNMTFMLQKEVVSRLAASPGTKDYGRLSVMVQCNAMVTSAFDVEPTAFDPPPKVMSKLVVIAPQYPLLPPSVQDNLQRFVRTAFGQRRKTIKNTLGKEVPAELLEKVGIGLMSRPEEIEVSAYLALARELAGSS